MHKQQWLVGKFQWGFQGWIYQDGDNRQKKTKRGHSGSLYTLTISLLLGHRQTHPQTHTYTHIHRLINSCHQKNTTHRKLLLCINIIWVFFSSRFLLYNKCVLYIYNMCISTKHLWHWNMCFLTEQYNQWIEVKAYFVLEMKSQSKQGMFFIIILFNMPPPCF